MLTILEKYPVICNHLHIPLQAGSDEILKRMNRKYDTKYYQDKIEKIRTIRPDISISTDVIVGFPGETEELFQKTLEFCEKMAFSKIHVFPYSVRRGTPASKFPNQIDGNIKKQRARQLIALSTTLEQNYMQKFVNSEIDVLIEQNKNGYSYGHTSNYLSIQVPGNYHSGQMITATITSVSYPYCVAKELIPTK